VRFGDRLSVTKLKHREAARMIPVLLCGFVNLAFALFHAAFWRLFEWNERLPRSGFVNAAITQILNLMLIYVFALYGGFLVWSAAQDVPVESGYLLAGAGFWVLRAALQPMLFGLRNRLSALLFTCFVVAAGLHAVAAI
jgi:hypothetical protein